MYFTIKSLFTQVSWSKQVPPYLFQKSEQIVRLPSPWFVHLYLQEVFEGLLSFLGFLPRLCLNFWIIPGWRYQRWESFIFKHSMSQHFSTVLLNSICKLIRSLLQAPIIVFSTPAIQSQSPGHTHILDFGYGSPSLLHANFDLSTGNSLLQASVTYNNNKHLWLYPRVSNSFVNQLTEVWCGAVALPTLGLNGLNSSLWLGLIGPQMDSCWSWG